MEIFKINHYTRVDVTDEYESFVWTERYDSYGDIQIVTKPTPRTEAFFSMGSILSIAASDRLMRINYISTQEDDSGAVKMTIKGRSFEWLLDDRSIAHTTTTRMPWGGTGSAGEVATYLANQIMRLNTGVYVDDAIWSIACANESSITEELAFEVPPQSLYKAIKDICDTQQVGFKIVLRPKNSFTDLLFSPYTGVDKSDTVMFSSAIQNLKQESYLYSHENYKNVAYVYAKDWRIRRVVYLPGVVTPPLELQRRILTVDATDVDPEGIEVPHLNAILDQRGRLALLEQRPIVLVDGETTESSEHIYRKHYKLGDTVTLFSRSGERSRVMVSEHIWAVDSGGVRSYPTFMHKE